MYAHDAAEPDGTGATETMPSEDDRPVGETDSLPVQTNGNGNEPNDVRTTDDEPKPQRSFGGLTPQEAGRRSAQRRAEQARAAEADAVAQSSGKVIVVRVPVAVGDIISRLGIDAKKGNTQAARELREWMREYPAEDETDISALDTRTRQQVIARVLADIAEDEGGVPDGPTEPVTDGSDS